MRIPNSFAFRTLGILIIALVCVPPVLAANLQVPAGTALPVVFNHTVDSRKAKSGDAVSAKTMQIVRLPGGQEIPRGSLLTGHVVEVEPVAQDSSPSKLAVQFESIVVNKESLPIHVFVRALAAPNESYDAMHPTGPVGADVLETITLIGGAYTYIADKHLYAGDDEIVGDRHGDDNFARMTGSSCGGSSATPQSVSIFSPSACGLYGFYDVHMTTTGDTDRPGVFTLESSRSFVRIYGRSTALLQVAD
jgi:hypothetical protein